MTRSSNLPKWTSTNLTFLFTKRRKKSRVVLDNFKTDSTTPAFASDFSLHTWYGNSWAIGQISTHTAFLLRHQWLLSSWNWAGEGNMAPAVTSAWKHFNYYSSSVSSQSSSSLILLIFLELRAHDVSTHTTASCQLLKTGRYSYVLKTSGSRWFSQAKAEQHIKTKVFGVLFS